MAVGDPTIPRRSNRRRAGLTKGRFVQYGKRVLLVTDRCDTFSMNEVSILSGSFGNDAEGVEKLPRLWKYDRAGKVVIKGDIVVVDFLDGNPKQPIVTGGVRTIQRIDEFLAYNHGETGGNANRMRVRIRPLDDAGDQAGLVTLAIADGDTGTVALAASHGVTIDVGGEGDGPWVSLEITPDGVTITSGNVKLGGSGATDAVSLATPTDGNFIALKSAIEGAAVTPGDGGLAFKTAIMASLNLLNFPDATGATKVKAE